MDRHHVTYRPRNPDAHECEMDIDYANYIPGNKDRHACNMDRQHVKYRPKWIAIFVIQDSFKIIS